MELDENGIRIEHQQPLRTFLAAGACNVPYELPSACGIIEPQDERLPAVEEQGPELLPAPSPTMGH
jgi:hypothetical protein